MKNLIKTIGLFCLLVILATCKKDKDKPTEEQVLAQHEQKIINQIDGFMPKEVGSMFEAQLKIIHTQQNYAKYLDSIETSINDLKNTIQSNFNLSDYQTIMNKALLNLQSQSKGSIDDCLGLGYSKGVKVDIGVAGKIGAGIVVGVQAAAGAGVKVTYDFVNLDRQIYIYSFCSAGASIGVGLAAALGSNVGFSGVNEVITGIRYYGNSSGLNRYSGQSISTSYSLGGKAATVLGVGLSLGVGTSSGAISNYNGIENQDPCTANMIPIINGTKAYSFKVTGTLSAGAEADLEAVFSLNKAWTNSAGIDNTYKRFADNRQLAGIRMAQEIMLTGPFPGITSPLCSIDVTASAVALIYSLIDFSNCPPVLASIGTKPITNLTSTAASCGGVIPNDGGSSISAHGLVWSTSENPTLDSNRGITNDGQGKVEFTSKIINLAPNTTYYVRAYATNNAGTAYGTQVTLKTPLNVSTPEVITTPVTVFTATSSTFGGNITDDGGASVTERGVYWGTSSNPVSTGTKLKIESVTNPFSATLSGLTPNTLYYVTAYAINSQGPGYGTAVSFTTLPTPNNPPLLPSNPSPTNGATSVSTTPTLTWTCSDPENDLMTFDVYFESTSNPTTLVGSNLTTMSYYPSVLNFVATYFWKVVAKDNHSNSTPGPVWSFTTQTSGGSGIIFNSNLTYGSVSDIDGNTYKTIQIGSQKWMAENLKTSKYRNGDIIPTGLSTADWSTTTSGAYALPNNDNLNNTIYGKLYNWQAVVDSRNVCPTGWHVPTDAEYTSLITFLGGINNSSVKLKETTTTHWSSPNTGVTNEAGFTALPGGYRDNNGTYVSFGHDCNLWTSKEYSVSDAWYSTMSYSHSIVGLLNYGKKSGFSVRCVEGEVTDGTTGKVTDIDNNVYNTVIIGTQEWMAENLKTTKYNDGTAIPNITVDATWAAATTGAYCDYSNIPANSTIYGRLYNWYAEDNNTATNVASNGGKNVCPTSWHVPTDTEWTTLTTYLGGESVAGGKLKETGTTHWLSPNMGATNETGFTALSGGYRYSGGSFYYIGNSCGWWSSTENSTSSAWLRSMGYNSTSVNRYGGDDKRFGFSVRCVKDN